ncbi:MAG: histidine kinase [Bacteroidales bacterium]|nr:histidine kinase [Bacteroidales bacterium]
MIKRGLYILFQPAILSLIIGCIVILLLPPVFNKYVAKTIKTKSITEYEVFSYHDLDYDGYSEEILYQNPPGSHPSLLIKSKRKIIDQRNFKGTYKSAYVFLYCDYNNDSVDEIFVFTIEKDSIYFYGINPFKTEERYFFKKFIDKCSKYNDNYDCEVNVCDFPNIDNNAYKEIVFEISTGLSLQPRNLYILDIFNDTVIKSPESGTAVYYPVAFDINNDGYNEYMGESPAHGNCHKEKEIPYTDYHAWLMVLDRNMKFLFEPIKFGGYKTILDVKPFKPKNTTYLVVFQKHQGPEDIENKLMLFDIYGNNIKERNVDDFYGIESSFLLLRDISKCDDLFMIYNNGQVEQLDSNLNTINFFEIKGILNVRPIRADIDMDGTDEFLFWSEDLQSLIITRNDFSYPVKIDLINDLKGGTYHSVIQRGNEKLQLYIQCGCHAFIFEYSKNPLHPFKYLIWAGIYGGVFLFLFLLQKVQQVRARHKYKTEKKIAELQLKSIKSQIDPHFTLNLINSIGALFHRKDSEKASYIFGKYARLLRSTILSSDNIAIPLKEEIEYVNNYLELEKFRYDGKFDYEFNVADGADTSIEIPKMLLHTFAENAIKHGIKHLKGKGNIKISIGYDRKFYYIQIEDNGVGRIKAAKYSGLSTGKGLKILDDMMKLYYELKKVKITFEITDLFDDLNNPKGTLVNITIPVEKFGSKG